MTNIATNDGLVQDGDKIQLTAPGGLAVAQLSAKAGKEWSPRLPQIAEVRLLGSYTRLRSDVEENYAARLRSDEWEVPVCEVVSACSSAQ